MLYKEPTHESTSASCSHLSHFQPNWQVPPISACFWARRNLTAQERANLYAGHTPLAVISASLGGGTHF
ncbi:hypothetical protein GS563_28305 [Rhodococcus hoagii]|nr:hypothetical protein [Prescottella equi]